MYMSVHPTETHYLGLDGFCGFHERSTEAIRSGFRATVSFIMSGSVRGEFVRFDVQC